LVVTAAVLAGLSVLMRGFGLAVIAGIVATALYRRAFRRAAVFCLVAAPFVAAPLVWSALHAPTTIAAAAGAVTGGMPAARGAEPGWVATWLYYTSYGGFWKLCVPNGKVLFSMAMRNLRSLLEQPASYCLFPPLGDGRPLGILFGITLSVWILAGVVRQARADRWRPIHFIFPFTAVMAVGWNYGLMDRFLLLFLPLLYAGLWVEAKNFFTMLRTNLRAGRPRSDRVLAAILMGALGAVGVLAVNEYVRGFRRALPRLAAKRAVLAREKNELYEWIGHNTDPGARFVAYEDVSFYLSTGRQAMRPIAFSTEAFYMEDEDVLKRDLMHITDVARHIRARYWVVSSDDFDMETGTPLVDERMAQLKSVLPLAFRSSSGKVQLYDLGCLLEPDRSECSAARRLLFPTESTL
jgi:ABC-type sugar transport system permease subunit